jgi:hypothetical protein
MLVTLLHPACTFVPLRETLGTHKCAFVVAAKTSSTFLLCCSRTHAPPPPRTATRTPPPPPCCYKPSRTAPPPPAHQHAHKQLPTANTLQARSQPGHVQDQHHPPPPSHSPHYLFPHRPCLQLVQAVGCLR